MWRRIHAGWRSRRWGKVASARGARLRQRRPTKGQASGFELPVAGEYPGARQDEQEDALLRPAAPVRDRAGQEVAAILDPDPSAAVADLATEIPAQLIGFGRALEPWQPQKRHEQDGGIRHPKPCGRGRL